MEKGETPHVLLETFQRIEGGEFAMQDEVIAKLEANEAKLELEKRALMQQLLTGKRRPISDQQGRHVGMVWAEELVPPFPGLVEAAAGLATFPLPKEGAAVQQFWVFKESTDNAATLPATALQMYLDDELAGFVDYLAAFAPEDERNAGAA